ncbi:hypothetical protein M513_12401 [Trichuris suis]|uniref:Uncharacterized protein n=1 Tax=Trichuris suis TaxID=68888 RepID=A0A085LNZ5_9BILA|nr:hypothetical protein M513_12401 [Trichuris suis]
MPRPFSAIDSSAHDLGIDQTVALSRGNSSTSAMNNPRRKTRQYSTEYLKYGFIRAPGNKQLPMCMMCEKVFSNEAMKPSRLKEHLMRCHPDKRTKDAAYFRSLQEKIPKRRTLPGIMATSSRIEHDCLLVSYRLALMIAKAGKAHSIGEELILPAAAEIIETVLHQPARATIDKIPLSRRTVKRRIDAMARDIEDTLFSELKNTEFALQLDESTLPGNEALLLAYVRFVKGESLAEELLFAKELLTNAKGESIFRAVSEFFKEKEIPLQNLLAVGTDGAPSMVGRHRGFIAYLKEVVPDVLAVHCVLHRQQLVAKRLSARLNSSLRYVIAAVNRIKANASNDRLFRQLCDENDEDYNRLLLHTEVRWLSRGACLTRFYELFGSVTEFLEAHDAALCENLRKSEIDIAYLADLYFKFNEMNKQLQSSMLNLVKTKTLVGAFLSKLKLYKCNLGRREFSQFPTLAEVGKKLQIADEDVHAYCEHLEMLHENFVRRFGDIFSLVIPDWLLDPFIVNPLNIEVCLQEELVDLQSNEELKPRMARGYEYFWLHGEIPQRYTALWAAVKKLLIAIPSSAVVERGFSVVTDLVSKKRNRFEVATRGDLRLRVSSMQPNIERLISSCASCSCE